MTFRPPTDDELRALERELGLHFSADEHATYSQLVVGMLSSYARVESADDALPAATPEGARRWREPSAAENPLNAWYVRTEPSDRWWWR